MKLFKHVLPFLMICFFFSFQANAQDDMITKEQLMAKKAELQGEADKFAGEAAAIQAKIDALPGWRKGLVGTVGAGLNGSNDWFALTTPNAKSNTIGLGINAFANNIQPKFFWRNLLNLTIQRTATSPDANTNPIIALAEGLDLSSLYGYKLSEKIAISAEGKYTTSIIQYDAETQKYKSSINNPGKITVSAGITWTPINNLVVIIHPLGYELNFPGDFISAPGAKVGATYAANILKGVSWSSNLSAFIPYSAGDGTVDYTSATGTVRSVEYGAGDLVNYTWLNGFSMKILNGITVALNVGLRGDNQIADKGAIALADDPLSIDVGGLKLQSYYTLGVGYTF